MSAEATACQQCAFTPVQSTVSTTFPTYSLTISRQYTNATRALPIIVLQPLDSQRVGARTTTGTSVCFNSRISSFQKSNPRTSCHRKGICKIDLRYIDDDIVLITSHFLQSEPRTQRLYTARLD